ncbi:MAG: hypothetical protein ACPH44_07865, partial [Parvibaculales bacterium]
MSLRDHPEKFDVGFLAGLFGQPGEALSGFDFVPVGTGQVGDSYRVTLDWAVNDVALPKSLVAKCPAVDAVSRDTARNMNLYEIETKFYEHFGTNCGARVPNVYLADYDAAIGDGILLFEDMAPAEQIAQMDGCSLARVEAVLREAALLHKSHWNDDALSAHEFLTYGQKDERRAFVSGLMSAVYPEWRARYAERIDENILTMGDALVAQFDAYLTPRDGPM